jgi:CII-binding regulator of phage lambda lysogenization HflD
MCEPNTCSQSTLCETSEQVSSELNYTSELKNEISKLENDVNNANMNYDRFNELYLSALGTIYNAIHAKGDNISILQDGLKKLLEIEANHCK